MKESKRAVIPVSKVNGVWLCVSLLTTLVVQRDIHVLTSVTCAAALSDHKPND
jgi:hypothetical protein